MESFGPENGLLAHDLHVQATYRLTEALVSSEKRMRRRIELLSEVVFETDAAGALTFLNRAWKDTLGFDPEASLGTPLRNFVTEEDRALLDRTLTAGLRTDSGSRPRICMLHQNAAQVWMEVSASRLDDGGVVGTLHDVTRQRLAQAELAMLSLVASYTDSLVIISDGDGYIEWVNEAFTKKTGYSLQEAAGRKPGSFLQGPGTDPETVALIHQRLREGSSFQFEILNYTKAGEEYWVAIHISPIRTSTGSIERFVSIQTDITELRRTQQDLKTAKEAAESASEAKTQFLATISHEMRTPLNVILGTTELALENTAGSEHRYHLTRINENAEALLGLITDLLDVSKIEAGQIEWERMAFPLRNCLQKALAPIVERATRKGLSFQMVLDDQLPEKVLGDPIRLRQIVVNLAENAVKFTDNGFVRVEVTAVRPGPYGHETGIGIRVTDSGLGIPAALQSRVFDRFFQGDSSTTRRKGGAGLGLSIVKSLVDAMGGTIRVESGMAEGAEFYVLLYLEPVVEPERRAAEDVSSIEGSLAPVNAGAVRILVAEDNDDNYAIVHRHLTNKGYVTERAVNGRIAADLAMQNRYDLILMDLEMPEMDGLQTTRLIRMFEESNSESGRCRRVPILALTAHAVKGYRERCLQSGCTGYLAKPVRKQTLLEAVANALSESGTASAHQSDQEAVYVDVDPELLDLVPRFLENCRRDVRLILDAVATGNWPEAVRIGHSMKGSAPSYGFETISQLGRQIEAAGNVHYEAGVQEAAGRLTAYLSSVRVRNHTAMEAVMQFQPASQRMFSR